LFFMVDFLPFCSQLGAFDIHYSLIGIFCESKSAYMDKINMLIDRFDIGAVFTGDNDLKLESAHIRANVFKWNRRMGMSCWCFTVTVFFLIADSRTCLFLWIFFFFFFFVFFFFFFFFFFLIRRSLFRDLSFIFTFDSLFVICSAVAHG
jgi:hypothetical protein